MKKFFSLFCFLLIAAPAYGLTTSAPATTEPQYNFRLGFEETEQAVSDALATRGAGAKVAATINGNRDQALFSYDKPIEVEIRGLTFDAEMRRWSANVLFLSDSSIISALPIAGRYEEVVELPVLKRAMRSGDTIAQDDVEMRNFPVSRVHGEVISDAATLIGKSPLRVVTQNRPIRTTEIATPTVIKKNSIVQMRYNTTGMKISTSGQALADGRIGQMVAVKNLASQKMVYGTVSAENEVTVLPASSQQISQQMGVKAYETN